MARKTQTNALYSVFQKAENRVGGGEGLIGIYGAMTQTGMASMLSAMVEHTGLGPDSVLVDIGAGLCRPLLHAILEVGVAATYGVELDPIKCQKAVPFVQTAASLMAEQGMILPQSSLPKVICASVEELGSLAPATHAYAAWEGFPEEAKQAVGQLFAATPGMQSIAIVQRSLRNQDPADAMEELGFGSVRCAVAAVPMHMAGSGRKLNGYLFIKDPGGGGAPRTPDTAACPAKGKVCVVQKHSLESAPAFNPSAVNAAISRLNAGQPMLDPAPQLSSEALETSNVPTTSTCGTAMGDGEQSQGPQAPQAVMKLPQGDHTPMSKRPVRRAAAASSAATAASALDAAQPHTAGEQPDTQAHDSCKPAPRQPRAGSRGSRAGTTAPSKATGGSPAKDPALRVQGGVSRVAAAKQAVSSPRGMSSRAVAALAAAGDDVSEYVVSDVHLNSPSGSTMAQLTLQDGSEATQPVKSAPAITRRSSSRISART